MLRDKFRMTLLLSIPTLLWSGMVRHMFGFSAPTFPGSDVPALFGAAVYFYAGLVFVKGGLHELRDRKPAYSPSLILQSPTRQVRRSSRSSSGSRKASKSSSRGGAPIRFVTLRPPPRSKVSMSVTAST
jgi:hypothetical protein